MIFALNFHKFLHTVYTYVLNSIVKILMMFAKYFEYYTIILGEAFFVDTLYIHEELVLPVCIFPGWLKLI